MRPVALILALTAGVCLAQSPSDFREKLYPVLEKAQCRLCHNDNGVASRTRLQFPPEDASAEEIGAFGLRLSRLVDRVHPEESALYRKPTNRTPHTGGERIHPGSPEEQKASIRGLVSAKGLIRHELGRRLRNLKFSPELRFELDPSIEYSVHISELLKKVLPHGGADEEEASR